MGVAPGEGEGGPVAAPAEGERDGPPPREDDRPHGELSTRSIWILGAVIGGFYAIGAIARGAVVAGLVGGVLATILCFLVLREVRERRRRRERLRGGR